MVSASIKERCCRHTATPTTAIQNLTCFHTSATIEFPQVTQQAALSSPIPIPAGGDGGWGGGSSTTAKSHPADFFPAPAPPLYRPPKANKCSKLGPATPCRSNQRYFPLERPWPPKFTESRLGNSSLEAAWPAFGVPPLGSSAAHPSAPVCEGCKKITNCVCFPFKFGEGNRERHPLPFWISSGFVASFDLDGVGVGSAPGALKEAGSCLFPSPMH